MQDKTILFVLNNEEIMQAQRPCFEKTGYHVLFIDNGMKALDFLEKNKLDLIIIDLFLPDMFGEEVCKTIRKKSNVPIIMIAPDNYGDSLLRCLKIGADDFIIKPFGECEIAARVKAIFQRATINKEKRMVSFNNCDLVIDYSRREVKKNGKTVLLTPNEFDIVSTLIQYSDKAFTRSELIHYALGDDYQGYERVIDTHIKNIRQKLENNRGDPTYIITVQGIGYRFGINLKEDSA